MTKHKIIRIVVAIAASTVVGRIAFIFALTPWMETRRIHNPSTYRFPTRELAELDRLLQVRFAEVPVNSFGINRIGSRHEIFKSVSATEKAAIESLRRQKQEVVFYVAGRNYLQKFPTAGAYDAPLQGPVFMTQKPPLKVTASQTFHSLSWGRTKYPNQPIFQTAVRPVDLPTEAQLREPVESMLVSNSRLDHTATPDGKTYRAGEWQIAAVPVRASDPRCVQCHTYISRRNTPRLGDPLGIAVYAFRSSAGRETKTKSVVLPVPSPTPTLKQGFSPLN